ncbi:GerAB/ArcD/ProY family transporter [Evansella cellulosilytica]|uniref:Spore germination protein n=1 Tax=Evansella cellulosilytica (strain ATCC 21833 / DSM 2522 / FERM P-1141 / JCM 9156 / N-4) TaxID=649639 RepID=E6TYZ9_EVAC2|nr:GerAB/ArcD/ProY family transporter [Evansella cellulosilytica]ADU32442.1 spore germination protein [Evansella cellulosilytica DSM 2522]
MKTYQVSQSQIVTITFMFGFASNTFLFSSLIKIGDYSSWYIYILSYGPALFFLLLMTKVGQKVKNYSFLDYGNEIVGKWIHKLVLVYLFFFTLHITAFHIKLFIDFTAGTYYPDTPEEVLIFLFCFVCFMGAYAGVEPIGRVAQYFTFLSLFLGISIPLLLMNQVDYDMTIAFINRFDMAQVWEGTIFTTPWLMDIIIILVIFHMIANPEKTGKSLAIGMGLHIITYIPILIMVLLVLGPYFPTYSTVAELEMLRQIQIANFLQNVDPFIFSVWIISIFVRVSFCLFVFTILFSKLVKINDYKKIAPIMGLLLFIYTINISDNSSEMELFANEGFPGFVWSVTAIPILYLLVAKIRGIKSVTKGSEKTASSDET